MKLLLIAAALVASSAQAARWDIVAPPEPGYTVITSPEDVSRNILASPLKMIDEGVNADRSNFAEVVNRNFPKLIEQNFARLNGGKMAVLLDGLSDQELSDLAQLYVNATADHGLPPALLYVMADRLSVDRLARVSQHFGYQRVYPAVAAMAPAKLGGFLKTASSMRMGPVAGEMRFGPNGVYAQRVVGPAGGLQTALPPYKYLNMTPYQIYESFRTAPVGALGVQGALYQSAIVIGAAYSAYNVGYKIGQDVVGPLIQTYAPDFYAGIGPVTYGMIDNLTTIWDKSIDFIGKNLTDLLPVFPAITPAQNKDFKEKGGDYQTTGPMVVYLNGIAGGACVRTQCGKPKLE